MLVDSFVYIHWSMVALPLEGGRQGGKTEGWEKEGRREGGRGKRRGRSIQMIRTYSCKLFCEILLHTVT